MDRTEVTVGKLRTLVNSGTFTDALPVAKNGAIPDGEFCAWLGANDPANDALPDAAPALLRITCHGRKDQPVKRRVSMSK